jgi:hypothetical protein
MWALRTRLSGTSLEALWSITGMAVTRSEKRAGMWACFLFLKQHTLCYVCSKRKTTEPIYWKKDKHVDIAARVSKDFLTLTTGKGTTWSYPQVYSTSCEPISFKACKVFQVESSPWETCSLHHAICWGRFYSYSASVFRWPLTLWSISEWTSLFLMLATACFWLRSGSIPALQMFMKLRADPVAINLQSICKKESHHNKFWQVFKGIVVMNSNYE